MFTVTLADPCVMGPFYLNVELFVTLRFEITLKVSRWSEKIMSVLKG